MANSPLDFPSTETFRNRLMVRNLAPYAKSPNRATPPINFEIIQSNYSVIDSPDDLIDQPTFANRLYPLNQYGADGGYEQVRDPNTLQNTNSNEGEYGVQDANLIQEAYQEAPHWKILNAYGNGAGNSVIDSAVNFSSLEILQINQGRTGNSQPYPTTFVASFYSPAAILLSPNPGGSNGLLSQDSFIARLGAKVLRVEFQERIAREIRRQTVGRANILNANSGTDVLGLVTGQIPLIQPNYQITVPSNPIIAAADFALRLAGSTIPVSPIPGSYFDASINPGQPTTIQQLQNAYNNTAGQTAVGQILSTLLGTGKNGSQLFLNNTGAGQKSRLFGNLDYNRYKPGYDRNIFDRLAGAIVGTQTNNSNYYIGSTTSEPSRIFSPSKSLPVNEFGKEIQSPVFGPVELAQLYEGPSKEIRLAANGPIYSDGGGVEGGLTWVSPKYKNNAGKKVGVGGEIVKEDSDFKESSYAPTESTNITFKTGSILDDTQRLINSQPQGGKRLQHVGNAIDQVSKVFHDGYRELTKGSRVLTYVGDIGQEKGTEYCRVFAKDTPYLQYNDLQKTDGMTTEGRRFSYSVLDKTYNLNMYPNKREGGQDSTNLVMGGVNGEYAKKYMFSIENLAWRTSNRPGYTVTDLPVCERGPNGGRVMWFPPYGLTFNETSSANWKSTDFLGRPEPVYTYNNTSRTGSLTWKIVVDHPSVLNLIVNKVLANETNKVRIDSILESFFAGCRKYDLYDLAKKYYTVNPNDLFEIQKEIQNRDVSTERMRYVKQSVTTGEDATPNTFTSTKTPIKTLDDFNNKGVYFGNDYPKPGNNTQNYTIEYARYTAPSNVAGYVAHNSESNTFFNNVITPNYQDMDKLAIEIDKLLSNSENKGTISLTIASSCSAPASQTYNFELSKRRIGSLITYFTENVHTKNHVKNNKLLFNQVPKGERDRAQVQQYTGGQWQSSDSYYCSDENGETGAVGSHDIYTTKAMACRRAYLLKIDTSTLSAPDTKTTVEGKASTKVTQDVDVPENYTETTQVPEEVTKTVIRDNITKRVLRSLLSECDYFETIKEETPMVYDNLREKLKFFNPAFHSTTPEGLNSRLTFLQQCLRPGDTIPVTQKDGTLQYNNATNTAFGTPPVLILRVGDFFHTKIIPDSLALTYENLDINPEGIGIQPMIANITMSFKFVGGQGLAGAVDKLQNALTFNYYANTEMYDDRADVTDTSYKVLDKEFLDYFNIQVPPPTVNQVQNNNGQSNGQTIGVITSATTTQSGETGFINYQGYMNGFLLSTQNYFTTIFNKNKEVVSQYNNAVRQVWNKERNYTNGAFLINKSNKTKLFGKPKNVEQSVDKIFSDFINDIDSGTEGFIQFIKGTTLHPKNFTSKAINAIKDSYKTYIKAKKSNYQSALTKLTQDLVIQEQNLITNIAKNNVITFGQQNVSGTDGLQQKNSFVKLYVTLPTTKVNDTTYPDTLRELVGDSIKIASAITQYDSVIQTKVTFSHLATNYDGVLVYGDEKILDGKVFVPFSKNTKFNDDVSFQRSYFILNQDVIDDVKYATFKQQVIGNLVSNPSLFAGGDSDIGTQFDAYWKIDATQSPSAKTLFVNENAITQSFFTEMEKNQLKNYLIFTPFTGAKIKKYEFTYNTEVDTALESPFKKRREELIKALGNSTNQYPSFSDWSNETSSGILVCKVKLN